MTMKNPFLRLANNLEDRPALGKGLRSPLWRDPATGGFQAANAEDNVKACIADLVNTEIGERLMNEDFGTIIPRALFESMQVAIDVLPVNIREAIVLYEPRVTDVRCSAVAQDETAVRVDVSWTVRATGRSGSLVFPYYLEGGRNNG